MQVILNSGKLPHESKLGKFNQIFAIFNFHAVHLLSIETVRVEIKKLVLCRVTFQHFSSVLGAGVVQVSCDGSQDQRGGGGLGVIAIRSLSITHTHLTKRVGRMEWYLPICAIVT